MDFAYENLGEFGHKLFVRILEFTSNEGKFNNFQISKGDFETMLNRCKKLGVKYEDENFPPNENSLISNWDEDEVQDKVEKWSKYVWRRATDFLDAQTM